MRSGGKCVLFSFPFQPSVVLLFRLRRAVLRVFQGINHILQGTDDETRNFWFFFWLLVLFWRLWNRVGGKLLIRESVVQSNCVLLIFVVNLAVLCIASLRMTTSRRSPEALTWRCVGRRRWRLFEPIEWEMAVVGGTRRWYRWAHLWFCWVIMREKGGKLIWFHYEHSRDVIMMCMMRLINFLVM